MCKINLMNGDCFELMKDIPDRSIDLILTDPPYNIANYSTGNINFKWRSNINNDLEEWDRKILSPSMLINDFKRILKPGGNIFIFCSYNLLGEYHKVFDPEYDTFQFMVWHKTNPTPNIRKSSFLNSCELIICCWNKGHTWNFTKQNEMHNFIESPICMGNERIKNPRHPAQKPLKILEHIIKIASNKGDTVCDMFSGVGSTGVAAINLKRNFVGIELDTNYFEAGKKRIAQALGNNVSWYNHAKIYRKGLTKVSWPL